MFFSMTCMISSDEPDYKHFNIWNCEDDDVKLYYPEGLNIVRFDRDEYEVCIEETDHSKAFVKGYNLIMEKINEV